MSYQFTNFPNQVLRAQLELSQVKQEIERRIKEKEDEFDAIRKTHQKALDSMQQALEAEARAKGEAIRYRSYRVTHQMVQTSS